MDSGSLLRGIVLSGYHMTVNGDMISTSDIDLDGGTLTVTGTLYQQSGVLNVNTGKLDVKGNYYIAGADSDFREGHETYAVTSGRMTMSKAADEVKVGGDFVVSTSGSYSGSTLTAGTMYIGGNFRHVAGNSSGFSASGSHKVVFNGSGRQSIRFDHTASHFNILELTRQLDNYDFTPDNCWTTLIQPERPVFGTPDLVLPAGLVQIEDSAFEGIEASIVYIPDNCTSIGECAFCFSSVTQVRIPADCAIGKDAFAGCDEVTIFGTIGSQAQSYCDEHDNCVFVEE